MIRKLPEDKIDHMVTSVGINNRSKDFQKTTDREANRICEACSGSTSHAVGVSFSQNLDASHQENLVLINSHLRQIHVDQYIEPMTPEETTTNPDNIHYTTETLRKIFRNITSHTGMQPKNL